MNNPQTKNCITKNEIGDFFAPLIDNKVILYYPFFANTYVLKHHYGLALGEDHDDIYLKEFDWTTCKELFEHIKRRSNDIFVCFTNEEKINTLENISNSCDYCVEKIDYSRFFYRYIFLEKDSYVSQLYKKACELEKLDHRENDDGEIYNNSNFKHPRFSKYISQLIKKGYKSITLITDIPDEANSLIKKLFYEKFGLSYKLFINEQRNDSINIFIKGGPQCSKYLFDEKEKYICFEIEKDTKWTSKTYLAIVYRKKDENKNAINSIKKVLNEYSNILFSTVKEQIGKSNTEINGQCLLHTDALCNIHDKSHCKSWVKDQKYYCLFDKELFEGINYLDLKRKIINIKAIDSLNKEDLAIKEEKHFIRCLFNHHLDENEIDKIENDDFTLNNMVVSNDFRESAKQILFKISKLNIGENEIPIHQVISLIVWKEIFEKKLNLYEMLSEKNDHEGLKKMFSDHKSVVSRIERKVKTGVINIEPDNSYFLNAIHFALHLRFFTENYDGLNIDPELSINEIEMFFLYTISKNFTLLEKKPV
jgi:hypothetical protein